MSATRTAMLAGRREQAVDEQQVGRRLDFGKDQEVRIGLRASSNATRSSRPARVDDAALIRSATSVDASACFGMYASALLREVPLSRGETLSSRSMIRASAPTLAALAKRSGFVAGVNSWLRPGIGRLVGIASPPVSRDLVCDRQ